MSDHGIASPKSPTDSLTVISIEDAAIDREATGDEGVVKYAISRDESDLVIAAGATPVRYTLRPLTRAQLFKYVDAVDHPDVRHIRALACALERVDGHPDFPAGCRLPTKKIRDIGHAIDEDWLFEHIDPPGALYELGKLAYDRAQIPKGERRACGPPRGSLFRLAEWRKNAEMRTRLDATPPPPESNGHLSEGTGDATATATSGTTP